MGGSGGRPAANVVYLPGLAGAHFADGDQLWTRRPLNFQQHFHDSLIPADGFPDIVRFLHGAVFQEQSAADVHFAVAREFLTGKQHRIFAGFLPVGVRVYAVGGITPLHQPGAVPRIYGAAGALGVGLLLRQGFRQAAVRVEHVGGYTARGVVVQAHGCAHGFQQFVHLAGGVQIPAAHVRLAAENDRAAVFDKRPDFLHKFFVKGL